MIASLARKKCENEGSSGDVDENKEGRVSSAKGQVSVRRDSRADGCVRDPENSAKMKVHPAMLMKTSEGWRQAQGFRYQGLEFEFAAEWSKA